MAKGKSQDRGGVEALDRSPSHLLHRAVQVALDLYAEEFGGGGLTQRQYALLAAAGDHDGASQTDLVRITGIDRSTLADMTGRLIAKGLLERERSSEDGRANTVRLTPAGREALTAAAPRMAGVDARLLKLIAGKGRREQFVELLSTLIAGGQRRLAPPREKTPKADAKAGKVKKPKLELVAPEAGAAAGPDDDADKPARRKKKAKKAA